MADKPGDEVEGAFVRAGLLKEKAARAATRRPPA
jgi:hypothetical protein